MCYTMLHTCHDRSNDFMISDLSHRVSPCFTVVLRGSPFGGKGKAKESDSSEVEDVPPKVTPPALVAPAVTASLVPLIVSGCQNPTISDIVKGTYFRHGSNHGKPVYKKKLEEVSDDDDLDVLIYYWDDRDGEENCGWWFSPSVGGEMVWAFHPSRKAPWEEWSPFLSWEKSSNMQHIMQHIMNVM